MREDAPLRLLVVQTPPLEDLEVTVRGDGAHAAFVVQRAKKTGVC
jgi:hypothetical protein